MIKLGNTNKLLSEKQFIKVTGMTNLPKYRKTGLIKPISNVTSSGFVNYLYHPKQINELKKKLGITLSKTNGLLSERQLIKASGFTRIAEYRRRGIIKPIGSALSTAGLSYYYHPKQIKELKNRLRITIESTKGLLNEREFRKVYGLTNISKYRELGLIKPVGRGISNAGLSPYYHPKQIKELKKKLGITLENTKGLLNESKLSRLCGLTALAKYRKQGLIKPVGYGMSGPHIGPYYNPKQIKKLKKKLGITLGDTNGLFNETEFMKKSGLSRIRDYRVHGLIKPVGYAFTKGGRLSPYYHPKQMKELKRKLKMYKFIIKKRKLSMRPGKSRV